MDEDVMERDGERKALGASLLLHLILFLTAAAMGLRGLAPLLHRRRNAWRRACVRWTGRRSLPAGSFSLIWGTMGGGVSGQRPSAFS